jgi:hypothetical protein
MQIRNVAVEKSRNANRGSLLWMYMGRCTCVHGPRVSTPSGWLSGPSNVSGLAVELQQMIGALMPSLQLSAWKEGCGRSGRQKGSRMGSLGLSKLATHRAKAVWRTSAGSP